MQLDRLILIDLNCLEGYESRVIETKLQDFQIQSLIILISCTYFRDKPPSMSGIASYMLQDFSQSSVNHCNGIRSPIGALKSNWTTRGKLKATNSGTAFLITPYIIVTCAHNIFSEVLSRNADQIQFFPDFTENSADTYHYTSKKNLTIKRLPTDSTFALSPLKEELCLIILDEPIYTLSPRLSIGQLVQRAQINSRSSKLESAGQKLKIIGYPKSNSYNPSAAIKSRRSELSGELICLEDHVIHHNLATEPGHSGSPIMALNRQGNYYVVGIHTHRSLKQGQYSGLYFNDSIIAQLKGYVQQLNTQFSLSQKIIFQGILDQSPESQEIIFQGISAFFPKSQEIIFEGISNQSPESEQQKQSCTTQKSETDSFDEAEQWQKTSDIDVNEYEGFFIGESCNESYQCRISCNQEEEVRAECCE